MDPDEKLADEAEAELQRLKDQCKSDKYSDTTRDALWSRFRHWIAHPMFAQHPGMLRCVVLNELQFSLSIEELKSEAWLLIGELVARWERDSLGGLMDAIRIASLECIAEPPERPDDLRQLFRLAANPHTRWAVFAAYENVPWRLRPHAHKYSNGSVTDADCDDWLAEDHWDDEVLMSVPRATPFKNQG
jgi:hypothetical protein